MSQPQLPLISRLFLAVTLLLAAAYLGRAVAQPAAESSPEPVRHVVAFKFKPEVTAKQIAEVETAFAALPSKIDGIDAFEWGQNTSPENRADGCTHCFLLTFHSAADRDAYLPHPEHKEFGKLVGPLLEKVFVIDYVPR